MKFANNGFATINGQKPVDRVLAALTQRGCDPRPCGAGKWEARCPVHQGRRRNLSISESTDETVLVRCHHVDDSGRNCAVAEVVAALGLKLRDLFRRLPGSNGKAKAKAKRSGSQAKAKRTGRPAGFDSPREAADFLSRKLKAEAAAHWIYRDPDGTAYAAVYRFDTAPGKTYRPVTRDPTTGHWGLKDPPQWLPYRVGEIADAKRVYIVEGEKCVDLARGLGLTATTTAHGAQSPRKTDLSALAGKEVVILPDHDKPGEGYAKALLGMLAQLNPRPTVRIVRLPGLTDEGDDFEQWLGQVPIGWDNERTRAALESLAEVAPTEDLAGRGAAEANGQATEEIRPNEAVDDPDRLARLFVEGHATHPDGHTLRYWQGEWLTWDGAYRPVPTEDIKARLHPAIKAEFDRINREEIAQHDGKGAAPKVRKVTTGLINNVVGALTGITRLEPRTPQPSWLEGSGPFPAADVLPTRNALVHLPSFVAGKPNAIVPPTPRFFCGYSLDYDFDPDASEPARWLEFLHQVWPDDPESINTLQEWFGLLLTPDTSHQKILLKVGPRRSGKGTIDRTIKALIGPENVANPTLSSLGTNFGLAPLIGKPAAIITDARLSGRSDVAQVIENLLSISGEDGRTIDRKHQPALTVTLPTRFTITANELPRMPDSSGALPSRMIILRFTRSFYGHEDRGLTDAIKDELPGVLLWAIAGWERLRERGHFIQPASAVAMAEELADLGSPVGAFLRERCRIEPGAEVAPSDLFAAWKRWCEEHGRSNPGDHLGFGRNLRAAMPHLEVKQRRVGGAVLRLYQGIGLIGDDWKI